MTATGRGRPRSEAIGAQILDATIEELIENGHAGLTMEAVAARAGVAKTTVYRRWADTSDLVLAALRRIKDDALDPPAGPVRDQLVWLVERMRRTWVDPRYAAVMRRVAADGTAQPEVYSEGRSRLIAPHVAIMHAVLDRGVAEGLIRDDIDVEWIRQLLVGPVSSSVLNLRGGPGAAQIEAGVDIILRGLAP